MNNNSYHYHFISPQLSPNSMPSASAVLKGGSTYPDITGIALFYRTWYDSGLFMEIELSHLPVRESAAPYFMGLHIHERGNCSHPFEETGMHYNPDSTKHPHHRGDLPPILNNNGYAYMIFYDSFLSVEEITGRSVVLHSDRDDFTSQPSGDSGEKIACGEILPFLPYRH